MIINNIFVVADDPIIAKLSNKEVVETSADRSDMEKNNNIETTPDVINNSDSSAPLRCSNKRNRRIHYCTLYLYIYSCIYKV